MEVDEYGLGLVGLDPAALSKGGNVKPELCLILMLSDSDLHLTKIVITGLYIIDACRCLRI